MALHELATNAVKYGALSVPSGKVRIEWRLAGPAGARRFKMSWVESGGAPVSPPKATGFGRMVIERMAAEALQGEVKLEFRGGRPALAPRCRRRGGDQGADDGQNVCEKGTIRRRTKRPGPRREDSGGLGG